MKRWMILVPMLLYGATSVAWRGAYDRALEEAKRTHKGLMVLLVRHECPACNEALRRLFMKRPYLPCIERSFVSVIVTADARSAYPVELYYSTVFPTLFFVDSRTQLFLVPPLYDLRDERAFRRALWRACMKERVR